MPIKHVYLKIEPLEDYCPVARMSKTAPLIRYRRDCMYGPGDPGGVIQEAEVLARSPTALVYREYTAADYVVPVGTRFASADVHEPNWSRRVPGTVIYAYPGDTLKITVLNGDIEPHSLHVHGFEAGVDSDGAWPFGSQSADDRRSVEICPGESWTYTFQATKESIGAWPFHDDSSHHPPASIDRGLFGGIVVLPGPRPRY